jgi:hypothetical protein
MTSIDANRLLTDSKYRTLLSEYHILIFYIASIQSAGVQFHKISDLYELKEELIEMLKETFPLFDIFLEKQGEHYDLDEDELTINID